MQRSKRGRWSGEKQCTSESKVLKTLANTLDEGLWHNQIKYIEWTEGFTKTRLGSLVTVPQKPFASNTECCTLFDIIKTRRFPHLWTTLLDITQKTTPLCMVTYSVQSVGESKIKIYMKTMASLARIDKSGRTQITVSVKLL